MVNELNFNDLTPIEVPVTLGSKKYVLREASEGTSCTFNAARLRGSEITRGNDGKMTVRQLGGAADLQPLLVSLCLYAVGPDNKIVLLPNGDPDLKYLVPLATVRSWPARVVKPLFEKAKAISGLSEEGETQKDLEERFAETAGRLVSMSENGRDRDAWRQWMVGVISDKLASATDMGPEDGRVKNSLAATTDSSV